METVNLCPTESEISSVGQTRCSDCGKTFSSSSCLEMHLIKRHRKPSDFLNKRQKGTTYRYYCFVKGCKYELNDKDGKSSRHFTKMKYLRQHYLKSHAEKSFQCVKCDKKFPCQKFLEMHTKKECGVGFVCALCGLVYSSREALLTHLRRSGHQTHIKKEEKEVSAPLRRNIRPKPSVDGSKPIESIAAAALSELSWKVTLRRRGVDMSTQTTDLSPNRRKRTKKLTQTSSATQTDRRRYGESEPPTAEALLDLPEFFSSGTQTAPEMVFDLFRDIESQAKEDPGLDIRLSDTHTQTMDLVEIYSHNFTQTCDDIFLNDFVELSDIETQTAWASLAVDSSFVSAQTQTLF